MGKKQSILSLPKILVALETNGDVLLFQENPVEKRTKGNKRRSLPFQPWLFDTLRMKSGL
jgi:hypothetical protein